MWDSFNGLIARYFSKIGSIATATVIQRLLALIALTIIARHLGPDKFGTYSIFFNLAILGSYLFTGFDDAFVRSYTQGQNPSQLTAYFVVKGVSVISVILLGLLLSTVLADFLHVEDAVIFYASAGAVCMMLANISLSVSLAREATTVYNLLLIFPGFLFLVFVAILTFAQQFEAYQSAYIAAHLLVGLSTSAVLIWRWSSTDLKKVKAGVVEMVDFGKWLVLSSIMLGLQTRLDLLLLGHFASMEEVGLYSAALRLVAVGSIVVGSILTVMKPKASKLSNHQDIRSYVADSALFTLLIAVLFIPLLLARQTVTSLFFGVQYAGAAGLFPLLLLSFIPRFMSGAMTYLFYPFRAGRQVFISGVIHFVSLIILSFALIPAFGAYGAALAFFLAQCIVAVVVGVLAFRLYRRQVVNLSEAGMLSLKPAESVLPQL